MHGNFTINTTSSKENIRFKADMGGSSLYDVGCYLTQATRYLLTRKSQALTLHSLFDPDYDNVDMMASGPLEFNEGIGTTFQCGMWAKFQNTLEIFGADGRIDLPFAFLTGLDMTPNFSVSVKGHPREEIVQEVNVYRLQVD
jgi:xylose dehydrogenase (NAD/NADP)